jgi:hypothetical protein
LPDKPIKAKNIPQTFGIRITATLPPLCASLYPTPLSLLDRFLLNPLKPR